MQHSDIVQNASPSARSDSSRIAVNTNRVFILTFHGLGKPGPLIDSEETRYWLTSDAFERALDHISQWPNTRITFDDGNLSDLTVAVPFLLKHRVRARFFVVASRLGKAGYLGRSELIDLLAAGMEIGSHGMMHRSWRGLRAQDLQQEIEGAKAMLEDMLGIPITQAACPFGGYGRTVLKALSSSGFSRVYTSDRGWARPDAWIQSRNTITVATDIHDLELFREQSWPRRMAHNLKLTLKRYR